MASSRWTPGDYNRLEAAIARGDRMVVVRRGGELVIVPRRLSMRGGRESVEAVHPATGETVVFMLDEIERLDIVS